MKRPTKMEERDLVIADFARRLREAPPGMRVFMRVGDLFRDADVIDIEEFRTRRHRAPAVRGNGNDEG
jgi:hypothetical protein